MATVLCGGLIALDTVLHLAEFPRPGAKHRADRSELVHGGGALNAAILAMPEREQFALLMTLYKMGRDSREQAASETRQDIFAAHVDGRLKKKKNRGRDSYKVWVDRAA